MKFKATTWNKELEFEDFKKINIFVGKDYNAIKELLSELNNIESTIPYMHLGSTWYHSEIASELSDILNLAIDSNSNLFAYVNSLEVIQNMLSVIKKLNLVDDFNVIRIGKSARKSTKGDIMATYMSYSELDAMFEMDLEMR